MSFFLCRSLAADYLDLLLADVAVMRSVRKASS